MSPQCPVALSPNCPWWFFHPSSHFLIIATYFFPPLPKENAVIKKNLGCSYASVWTELETLLGLQINFYILKKSWMHAFWEWKYCSCWSICLILIMNGKKIIICCYVLAKLSPENCIFFFFYEHVVLTYFGVWGAGFLPSKINRLLFVCYEGLRWPLSLKIREFCTF